MRRKIWLAVAGICIAALALLIWRLDIPNWKKLELDRLTHLPRATEVFDQDGNLIGTLHNENRITISIRDIPVHVQQAFISAEDLRFYDHKGIDIYRMFGALWNNIKSMRYSQGASTITQQLIKLTHLSSEKTLARKAQEICLSLKLERTLTKDEILEAYLNVIYFGNGAYGIESAAQAYFGKTAGELTLSEGALLAGIIKSPSNYAPHLNPEKSISRRDMILNAMAENNFISSEEARAAKSEKINLKTNDSKALAYGWYMDAALSEAEQVLDLSSEEILSGGFQIHTGFSKAMQNAADSIFESSENFPENAADGMPAQASFIVLDTNSGEIRALVGGRSYSTRRGFNRALQMKRQPGSTFKPISTYAAAIDAYGLSPTSTVNDIPRIFSGGYSPGNAGGNSYGVVTLREALSKSLNIATVDLADLIGIQSVRNYALRFGIDLSQQDANLSLALGSLTNGVSPAELCASYCALGNGGRQVKAHIIRSISDSKGRVIFQASMTDYRTISSESAYMITDMLKTAVQSGSAKALSACGMPVAAKTGTVSDSTGRTRDIWTVAYTPDIAITIWMGFDNPDKIHSLPDSAGGSGYPARFCATFLNEISSMLSKRDFKKPEAIKVALIDSLVLDESHKTLLATENTPSKYITKELFLKQNLPTEYSDIWLPPESIVDFRIISENGDVPVLAFTPLDDSAEYVLLKSADGNTQEIAVLRGKAGLELRYADTDHDITQLAAYKLLPRNALLYENGILLAGEVSWPVQYVPGGIMNKIMDVGAAKATQTPTDINYNSFQSLFG